MMVSHTSSLRAGNPGVSLSGSANGLSPLMAQAATPLNDIAASIAHDRAIRLWKIQAIKVRTYGELSQDFDSYV